jgi:hypothetical protein
MLKRYAHLVVYLLMVLLPTQALATANILVCNGMMQSNKVETTQATMPCHQDMSSVEPEHNTDTKQSHQSHCMSVCASLCALTAIPLQPQLVFSVSITQPIDFKYLSYVSITPSSLHRPPISFIS